MIKDRLPDLKVVQHPRSYSTDEVSIYFDEKPEVTQFLAKVDKIRSTIDVIKANTDEIKKLNNIILSLPRGNEQSNSEVEERKSIICQTVNIVQKQLKEIEAVVKKDEKIPLESLPALGRIQRIQHSTSVWLFAEAVKDYNDILLKHQERCKAIVRQQLKIIDKVTTSEELEELLEKDGAAVFVDNIVADTLEAQLALATVKARHEEILKIESSIREIRDVFVQMAALLETQGDNIQRIEYHVLKASAYTDHGNARLRKAHRNKEKSIKRNRILLIILIVLVGIIIIFLLI